MEWNKGDILKSEHLDAIHPIIFLEGYDDGFFIGAMITSKCPERYPDNLPMEKEHFLEASVDGQKYEISYGPSYLVDAKLLKRLEWRPFTKVGELTTSGTDFVDAHTREKYPVVWEEYLRNSMEEQR